MEQHQRRVCGGLGGEGRHALEQVAGVDARRIRRGDRGRSAQAGDARIVIGARPDERGEPRDGVGVGGVDRCQVDAGAPFDVRHACGGIPCVVDTALQQHGARAARGVQVMHAGGREEPIRVPVGEQAQAGRCTDLEEGYRAVNARQHRQQRRAPSDFVGLGGADRRGGEDRIPVLDEPRSPSLVVVERGTHPARGGEEEIGLLQARRETADAHDHVRVGGDPGGPLLVERRRAVRPSPGEVVVVRDETFGVVGHRSGVHHGRTLRPRRPPRPVHPASPGPVPPAPRPAPPAVPPPGSPPFRPPSRPRSAPRSAPHRAPCTSSGCARPFAAIPAREGPHRTTQPELVHVGGRRRASRRRVDPPSAFRSRAFPVPSTFLGGIVRHCRSRPASCTNSGCARPFAANPVREGFPRTSQPELVHVGRASLSE